jgi:hypothetical protein
MLTWKDTRKLLEPVSASAPLPPFNLRIRYNATMIFKTSGTNFYSQQFEADALAQTK